VKIYFIIIPIFVLLIIAFPWLRLIYNTRKRKRTAFARLDGIANLNSNDKDCSASGDKEELPDTPHRAFVHSALIDPFFKQYVEPYIQVLQHNGYYESVLEILSRLDKYGDCSSVVRDGSESAYSRSENLYSLLGKISLLKHSLNVASEIISIVDNGSFGRDSDMRRGMLLIASLGHDLGKIPELSKKADYATGDHPIISQAELSHIMPDFVPERQKILDAVRDHHLKSKEFLTLMLKKADQQARAKEAKTLLPSVENKAKSHTAVPDTISNRDLINDKIPTETDLSWMNVEILKERIEEKINVLHENKFSAFSMRDGLVYVMPELISSIVYNLAETENHLDVMIEPKRNVEHTVRMAIALKIIIIKHYFKDSICPSRLKLSMFQFLKWKREKPAV